MASAGEIVRATIEYSVPNASDCINVFTFELNNAADDAEVLQAFEDFVDDDWGPAWQDFASNACSIIGGQVDILTDTGLVDRNIGLYVRSIVGTTSAEAAPSTLGGYLQANTNIAKTRGRKYVPGIPEDSIDSGLLDAEVLADLAVLLVLYLSGIEIDVGTELVAGVLARILEQFVPFAGNGTFSDVPAIQRRRKPTVGS